MSAIEVGRSCACLCGWAVILPLVWLALHWRAVGFVLLGAPYGVLVWWLFR